MSEDSARVTFDWVLDQVRWLLQVSSPAELGTLFQKMLEAQVFPNYHYLSPCEEEHSLWERGACETDREDLARRMALPMWQRWDACQGILQSVLHQEAVSSLECPGISLGNFWESWNAELIDNNVEDADSVLADLYSNSILLETVSCDQDLGDQRETGAFLEPCNPNGGEVQLTPLETVCFTQVSASATEKVYGPCALPVTRDSDQASVSQKNEAAHVRLGDSTQTDFEG
ncbi:uncharacterized protein ciita [Clupea harengus]|uniref:Uncharacterized protein ciita n=1 Tax=Clupea harengus TaxID=7950 RepID=A0A6P8G1H5_CLUHA|nr:uncharacterized protein ciita [Clupea harengus]